jgi:hypothetical protein
MLKFARDYNITPVVEHYKFENFPQAFEKAEFGRPLFKVVVSV